MARKPIERRLPALKSLLPRFRGFPKGAHRLNLVIEHLTAIARRLRKRRSETFYSMRETAAFFSVHLSTMALAYQHLENAGLVARVRGAHTMLLGRRADTHHPARSIVSVPLSLSSIVSSRFTRKFTQRISEELWKHHFVANIVLYDSAKESDADIAIRLGKQSDVVVWLFPGRATKETILTLRDRGVRNMVLRATEDPFVSAEYEMDWTSAYRAALLEWKREKITHVVVARSIIPFQHPVVENFVRLLAEYRLPCSMVEPSVTAIAAGVDEALKKHRRVSFAVLEHATSSRLCINEPAAIAALTRRCRVLFGRGPVYTPYFFDRDFRADIIGFDGDEVAVRVAQSLGRRAARTSPVTLQPQWIPRAKLGDYFV